MGLGIQAVCRGGGGGGFRVSGLGFRVRVALGLYEGDMSGSDWGTPGVGHHCDVGLSAPFWKGLLGCSPYTYSP